MRVIEPVTLEVSTEVEMAEEPRLAARVSLDTKQLVRRLRLLKWALRIISWFSPGLALWLWEEWASRWEVRIDGAAHGTLGDYVEVEDHG